MKRKSQIAGEIFIWILALLILAVIVFYGYKAISGFMQRGEEVSFIQFKNNLESEVRVLSTQLNDVVVFNERNPLRIPSKYKKVCFVSEDAVEAEIPSELNDNLKKIIKTAINTLDFIEKTENVFLEPPAANPIYVGKIELGNGILCVPVVKGRIDIRLTGLGGATKIEKI